MFTLPDTQPRNFWHIIDIKNQFPTTDTTPKSGDVVLIHQNPGRVNQKIVLAVYNNVIDDFGAHYAPLIRINPNGTQIPSEITRTQSNPNAIPFTIDPFSFWEQSNRMVIDNVRVQLLLNYVYSSISPKAAVEIVETLRELESLGINENIFRVFEETLAQLQAQ